jgi:hypothetical protein
MGRPRKKASERKSRFLSFGVDKAELKAYQSAAAIGFNGNVSDFLRAAADALAAQLERDKPATPEQPEDD